MMPDNESFASDDAVSNRSDDTALDESHVAGNGRESTDSIAPDAAPEHSEGGEPGTDQLLEQVASGGDESGEPVSQLGEEATEQEPESAEDGAADGDSAEVAEGDDAAEPEPAPTRPRGPVELVEEPEEEIRMDWYILKVQSNRERSIAEALERKMKIEGYDRYFDQVIVPTEKVTEFKAGKKKVVERKLYPGYIVVHMHINDDTWFAVRETSGVGDFTGAGGKPTPMLASEVARIIQSDEEETSEAPKLDIKFSSGDKVKVKEGNFENFEGEVNTIDEASGRVTVMINIFGRSTPVELEYWQIEAL
jgi:transcriptional antiterminator NusG